MSILSVANLWLTITGSSRVEYVSNTVNVIAPSVEVRANTINLVSNVVNVNVANITTANITTANINLLSLSGQPIWQGSLVSQSGGSNFNPTMVLDFQQSVPTYATGNSSIFIPKTGIYHVYVQQLTQSVGGIYLHIRKNGGTIAYGYNPGASVLADLVVSAMVQCSVGDRIDTYYQGTVATTWSNPHSSYFIHKVA